MRRTLTVFGCCILPALCCAVGGAFAQDPTGAEMPPLAPSVVPSTPLVLPPDVPPRPPLPIRVDPATVAASAPDVVPSHKPPLAWRARAHKLRLSNSAPQVVLQANYDNAVMQLIGAIGQAGLRVDTLNSKAGELLAVPLDVRASQKYVFVFAEMPPNTVTIKATPWSQTKTSAATLDFVFGLLRGAQ